MQEDNSRARSLLTEGLHLARSVGHQWMTAATLHHLGMIALEEGDLGSARPMLEESLATYRRIGFPRFIGLLLLTIGKLDRMESNPERSRAVLDREPRDFAGQRRAARDPLGPRRAGSSRCGRGQAGPCRYLSGGRCRVERGGPSGKLPRRHAAAGLWLADPRRQLGDKRFEAVWSAGQAMSPDEAVAYARAAGPPA